MQCYRWRTREDGIVVVQTSAEAIEAPPILAKELVEGTAQVRGFGPAIQRWEKHCITIEDRFSVPRGWLLSMGWRESGWNLRAFRREPKPADEVVGWTGIGTHQITHPSLKRRRKTQVGTVEIDGVHKPLWQWVGGLTDEELYEPRINAEIAARYITDLITRYGLDFPQIAAAYNAGSVRRSEKNPWCMVQTAGHVSAEVAALNYYLMREQRLAAEQAEALQFSTADLLGPDFGRVTLPDPDEVG
jgi:hypothetical protein